MDDIREQIALLVDEFMGAHIRKAVYDLGMLPPNGSGFIDRLLNIKCSRGGGVCPECKGKPYSAITYDDLEMTKVVGRIDSCPTCKGTGLEEKVTFTVLEAIQAAEEGKICGGGND